MYRCYLIFRANCTYVGITNNLKRRLRQHNGEIKGGAKYTTSRGPGWKIFCTIYPFDSKSEVMSFEKSSKLYYNHARARGIKYRMNAFAKTMNNQKFKDKNLFIEYNQDLD